MLARIWILATLMTATTGAVAFGDGPAESATREELDAGPPPKVRCDSDGYFEPSLLLALGSVSPAPSSSYPSGYEPSNRAKHVNPPGASSAASSSGP